MSENNLDMVERLRMSDEMLRDGHQKNLTKLWHSDVVKDAAKDCAQGATEIARLRTIIDCGCNAIRDAVISGDMSHVDSMQRRMRREMEDGHD